MSYLNPKQCLRIKSPKIDTNNCLNEVFLSFNSLNKELSPSSCLVDIFSNQFSFISVNFKDPETLVTYQNELDNIYSDSLTKLDTILIIADTSVKNNVATLISHIHRGQEIIAKTVHHTINVIFSEAKLFTIRCGINHATQLQDVLYIVVITNAIPVAKRIFDSKIHPQQLHSIAISKDLKAFSKKNLNNSIKF